MNRAVVETTQLLSAALLPWLLAGGFGSHRDAPNRHGSGGHAADEPQRCGRTAGWPGRPFAHVVVLPAGDIIGEVGVWNRYTYAGGVPNSGLGI